MLINLKPILLPACRKFSLPAGRAFFKVTFRTSLQGRIVISFVPVIFEITIWVFVVSTVINQLKEKPILIAFYAFGYASGNVVGIIVERKLALGIIILKMGEVYFCLRKTHINTW